MQSIIFFTFLYIHILIKQAFFMNTQVEITKPIHHRCHHFQLSFVCLFLIKIMIMSLMPVSSPDKDIGGVPSMQSSYFAEMKRYGICMEERRVLCKCVSRNLRRNWAGY